MNRKFGIVAGHTTMRIGIKDLMMKESGEAALRALVAFKASERKDDPERRQNLHGPYEELVVMRTGKLPEDYYTEGDNVPWGLRLQESRSNILWQVLSGMLDHRPEFASAYMGLALTTSLNVGEYTRELQKIHKNWTEYNSTKSIFNTHRHSAMKSQYHAVSCPACSVLTAMVCQDEAMSELFQKLVPMDFAERNHFLKERGFAPLLNIMIPEISSSVERHI